MNDKILTLGIDVGGSYIKTVLMDFENNTQILDKRIEKIRKRNPVEVSNELINTILDFHNINFEDVSYLSSTGEGEMVERKTGHFYSMTTH
ncbi:MAG: benzoyl-CoA reductase subunit D, partial [Bacteroidetes bacterium]|nr:benzoyl-CoA reductase subunit D [Bacteroidota bacterium]